MQENQSKVSQFDTLEEENELNALNAELEQARASLETDFAKFEAEKFSKDTRFQDLCFEDAEAFFKEILQDQNNYLSQNFEPKVKKAQELNAKISQKKQFKSIDDAVQIFTQKHPGVNIDELIAFCNEELPPKVQKELQNLEPMQFFEELYALYKGVYKKQDQTQDQTQKDEQSENLPKQIGGVPSSAMSANGTNNNENLFDRM